MKKWLISLLFFILSICFAMTMDLLLGYEPYESVNMLLSPFRLMFRDEIVMIMMAILCLILVEYIYAANDNKQEKIKASAAGTESAGNESSDPQQERHDDTEK